MFRIAKGRAEQGHRTVPFPPHDPPMPARFRGLPVVNGAACAAGGNDAVESCPTGALAGVGAQMRVDLGKCVFCGKCEAACPEGSARLSRGFRMAASTREGLVLGAGERPRVEALNAEMRRLLGRSLRLRQVSAGGCNGCEVEMAALQNVVFDFSRFGIQFVASPRHADGLLITGPVTRNMQQALVRTYEAVPAPKVVIAAGACAISGGPFAGLPEVLGGAAAAVPVDLFVAGCPPHPLTVLDSLLAMLGRVEADPARRAADRGP